jgi:lipase
MEPVVFIHGIFRMLSGLPAAPFFAPRPVLIPDMLGYGTQSVAPVETISVRAQADDLAARIRACGYAKAHIVGHSIGGAVATLLARHHSEVVKSFINVEGNFTVEDAFWTGRLAAMTLPEVDELLQSYRSDVAGWLTRAAIEPTPERIAVAEKAFQGQPAITLKGWPSP